MVLGLGLLGLAVGVYSRSTPPILAHTPLQPRDTPDALRLVFEDFFPPLHHIEDGRIVVPFEQGVKAILTLDVTLQSTIEAYLKKNRVPYGVFVAIEPNTGRVLALAEHSERRPEEKGLALRATYPAASIVKLVTAAAALEEKKARPHTVLFYHGSPYNMGPRYWTDHPRRDRIKTTLAMALAQSNNVVFAKVALRYLSAPILARYGKRFGFNRQIPFEMPVQNSQMTVEAGTAGLAEAATGFGPVTLSPLHAAMIAAALSHNGAMMAPCLVDRIMTAEGQVRYECLPKLLDQIVSVQTARSIVKMMSLTPQVGTARKAFQRRYLPASLKGMSIGGKTGSLTGDNPPGKYSWFVGMAPLPAPKLAIAVMVINDPQHWKIRAPDIAREGFSVFFEQIGRKP